MASTRENVQCRHIVITNNSCNESTNVTQEITNVVDVNAIGPRGPVGPIGPQGPTGSISALENLSVTGSLFVSGTSGNISATGDISASGQFLGSNFGLDSTDKLEFSDATLQFRLNDGSRITHTPTIFRPTSDEGVSLGRLNEKWKELVVNDITASGNISASGTGSFEYLKLNYDTIPASDPSIKGVVYRNGSNQLFISAG